MEHFYLHALTVLTQHPQWTLAVVFAAALLESLAFVGTFVPGSTAMFIAGALIGGGALDWRATLLVAVVGAVLGDGLSYWLGRRFNTRIASLGPFRKHPELLAKGREFFAAQGGKSILLARFVGPLRAVVPVVAGMLHMNPLRFSTINVVSACLWAPAHIVPGIVFGASVQLAGAVTARLAILLVVLLAVLWGSVRLARWLVSSAKPWLKARHGELVRHARTSRAAPLRLVLRLVDSDAPAGGALILLGAALVAAAWGFSLVLHRVLSGNALILADEAVFRFLQALRTPWVDDPMAVLATLGGSVPLASVVLAVTAWLALHRQWRTILYWLGAAGMSQLLVAVIKQTVGQHAPTVLATELDAYAFPSAHAAAVAVVYGFLGLLIARQYSRRVQLAIASATLLWIALVAFASLYLGSYWFSDVCGGMALGGIWLALLSLAYIYHRPANLPAFQLMLLTCTVMAASTVARIGQNPAALLALAHAGPEEPVMTLSRADWENGGWAHAPAYRTDLEGDMHEPFAVQWAGEAERVRQALTALGWQAAEPLSPQSVLLWVAPKTPALQLPVLPKLSNGVRPALVFVRGDASGHTRRVLRLWKTSLRVRAAQDAAPHAVWNGALTREHLTRAAGLLTLAYSEPMTEPWTPACAGHELAKSLGMVQVPRAVKRGAHAELLMDNAQTAAEASADKTGRVPASCRPPPR